MMTGQGMNFTLETLKYWNSRTICFKW